MIKDSKKHSRYTRRTLSLASHFDTYFCLKKEMDKKAEMIVLVAQWRKMGLSRPKFAQKNFVSLSIFVNL